MGNALASLSSWKALFWSRRLNIIVVGLNGAGKSTVFYKIDVPHDVTTIPVLWSHMEVQESRWMVLRAWDFPPLTAGHRKLYEVFYSEADALICVVDSNDEERIGEVRSGLQEMLADDALRDIPLLVFANKQDLPNALSPEELTDKLGLRSVARDWYVQPACSLPVPQRVRVSTKASNG
eukprot:TRINITY_DN2936_c0_g1_i1.p1 TRINITY_DN2936_c0_g1~~TRINITY_DN2936_c0_g1_i1.p1  ORF type:complete len:197 (+),score=42.05 TRINITY_DN2936_c0_g1_i1:55-591(+)